MKTKLNIKDEEIKKEKEKTKKWVLSIRKMYSEESKKIKN